MTPETRIARHYLGDSLLRVEENLWSKHWNVFFGAGKVAIASTVEEAARDAADQLRAQGWTPTHARLEWQPYRYGVSLYLHIDSHQQRLFNADHTSRGTFTLSDVNASCDDVMGYGLTAAGVMAAVAEWCAAHLPSLHLPPFPETPTAPPCAG